MRRYCPWVVLLLAVPALWAPGCREAIEDRPLVNQRPRTFLWLVPDSNVGVGISRQRIRWWGEDPDGVVSGFLFAHAVFPARVTSPPVPDTLNYAWVGGNDTLIAFPLDTLFRDFTVFVRSVDNTFGGIPDRSPVRLSPSPFLDANRNGVFDGGDTPLPGLQGAMDAIGAVQTFPVRNTPPAIGFLPNPNEPALPLKQPDTTFAVATFGWKGTDLDGDNTLVSYRIALNDSSGAAGWLTIPIRDTIVTLVVPRARSDTAGAMVAADVYSGKFLGRRLLGTVTGLRLDASNTLYLQVKDIAGEFSPVIRMPSGSDQWYVRRPRGKLLVVSDYIRTAFDNPLPVYLTSLEAIPGTTFDAVDVLDIARGLTNQAKSSGSFGSLVPPFVDPALVMTFLLYDYVVWYTDRYPSLGVAQLSLFTYLQYGGKVVFSTTFLNADDPRGALRDFAPIDSVSSENLLAPPIPSRGTNSVPASYRVFADSSVPANVYPALALNATPITHLIYMRPVYRRSDARYIYRLQADTAYSPARYIGTPNVGVVDGQGRIVFMGLPLHLLDNRVAGNPQGLTGFFTKVLTQGFNARRHVDRRRF